MSRTSWRSPRRPWRLGFSVDQVADGLRSFDPSDNNPGRMNIWTVSSASGTISVVIDLAHNEAGLEALLEIMNGIRPPHGRLLLGVGTAGDRSDEVFVRLGEIAGLGADVVEISYKAKYLRGRSMEGLGKLIREGAAHAGMAIVREHDSELDCLVSLVGQARDGDVVAIMTHQDRELLDEWLIDHGASRDDADALRAKGARFELRAQFELLAHRANLPPSSSLAEEERLARSSSVRRSAISDARSSVRVRVRHGIAEFSVVGRSGPRLRVVTVGLQLRHDRRMLLHADHHQVARVGPRHRVPDAGELVEDDLDLLAACALSHRLARSAGHELGDLARCAAAEIAVLAHDQHVEMPSRLAPSSRMSSSRRSPAVAITPIRDIRPRSLVAVRERLRSCPRNRRA